MQFTPASYICAFAAKRIVQIQQLQALFSLAATAPFVGSKASPGTTQPFSVVPILKPCSGCILVLKNVRALTREATTLYV